jgi:hypothetical protein
MRPDELDHAQARRHGSAPLTRHIPALKPPPAAIDFLGICKRIVYNEAFAEFHRRSELKQASVCLFNDLMAIYSSHLALRISQ